MPWLRHSFSMLCWPASIKQPAGAFTAEPKVYIQRGMKHASVGASREGLEVRIRRASHSNRIAVVRETRERG